MAWGHCSESILWDKDYKSCNLSIWFQWKESMKSMAYSSISLIWIAWKQNCFRFRHTCIYTWDILEIGSKSIYVSYAFYLFLFLWYWQLNSGPHPLYTYSLKVLLYSILSAPIYWLQPVTNGQEWTFPVVVSRWCSKSFKTLRFWIGDAKYK